MSTAHRQTIADLLNEPSDPDTKRQWRRLAIQGLLTVAAIGASLVAWAAAAPIAGAVVAPARVKVELNRKTVQHQEGGIVREILVREGQRVRAGDPLLVVGDLRTDAELSVVHRDRSSRARIGRAGPEPAPRPRFSPDGGNTERATTAEEAADHVSARARAVRGAAAVTGRSDCVVA